MKQQLNTTSIVKYQKNYSEEGLWSKIAKVAKKAGANVIYPVLLLYYVLMDEKTPIKYKGIILGSLGYFILPLDLLPDFIPLMGYTDDIAAISACIKAVYDCLTPEIKSKANTKLYTWFPDTVKIDEI